MTYFMTATVTFHHRLAVKERAEVQLNLEAENVADLKNKFFGFIGGERDMFVFSHISNIRVHKGEMLHKASSNRIEELKEMFEQLKGSI